MENTNTLKLKVQELARLENKVSKIDEKYTKKFNNLSVAFDEKKLKMETQKGEEIEDFENNISVLKASIKELL